LQAVGCRPITLKQLRRVQWDRDMLVGLTLLPTNRDRFSAPYLPDRHYLCTNITVSVTDNIETEHKMKIIEAAFIEEGYVSIPFSFNGAGHPIINVTFSNNVPTNILLDTGASANLLDYDFAKELGLNLTPTGEKGGGAGGLTLDMFSIDEVLLEISGQQFKFDNFLSMDFTSIKHSLISNGLAADFQGILGFGFFKMTKCFIDYSADRIFILKNLHVYV
jgi:hypothetical protein